MEPIHLRATQAGAVAKLAGVARLALTHIYSKDETISELPSLFTIYKDLHSHPELSGREERSARAVPIHVIDLAVHFDLPVKRLKGAEQCLGNGGSDDCNL